jgi:hypothetical protein
VPFEEFALRPVDFPVRQRDNLPGLRVELLAIAELGALSSVSGPGCSAGSIRP